ncbi:MAG: ATP-dependent helicase [Bacteroidetes bacterium]|nr:MAG: ATP-dependent helicase [Bacteroidota bacterium]
MRIVFNLYPFSETLYLPSANLVRTDPGGQLTHLVQRATPDTIGGYGLETTPVLQRLFALIDQLSPKALESRFKPPRSKKPTPLPELLQQPETRPIVLRHIHHQLDQFLAEVVRNQFPITLDAERRTLAKDVQLHIGKAELIPHLSFHKTAEGIDYRFQLGTETEKWNIREYDVLPVTNTDPAWIVANYTLFRVPGINGNMVQPFRKKDVIRIPPDKERVYFRQFILKNAGRTHIEAEGFALEKTEQLESVLLEATENVFENCWLLRPVFHYPGAAFQYGERRDRVTSLEIPETETAGITVHLVCRDNQAEQGYIEHLQSAGLEEDHRLFRVPGSHTLAGLLDWLTRNRSRLEKAGFILQPPQIDGHPLALLPANIAVESRASGDWFDVQGSIGIGTFNIPFKNFIPNLRAGNNLYLLPDDSYFLIPDEWFSRYSELARALRIEPDGLKLPKALFTVLQEGDTEAAPSSGFPTIDPEQVAYQPPPELKATLRSYQLQGVRWLIGHYQHGFGACLADDMGLGKTLQTIAALLFLKSEAVAATSLQDAHDGKEGPGIQGSLFQAYREDLKPLQALIILPASLVFNWQRELAQFAPSLFVYVHTGPKRLRDMRAIAGHDVVLTTYHTARQDLNLLGQQEWRAIVLDESQQIKNRESGVSRVVRALRGQYRVSLSGTPIENSLADLWTQMEFINPDTLGSFKSFREEFLVPIEKTGDEQAKQRLFSRIRPFFLRRTKEEVAPDLPSLSEQVFYSEMSPAQEKQYEKIRSAVRNEILSLFENPGTRLMALQALTRLRQMANHPVLADQAYSGDSGKFADVLAQWETIRRAGHKVLFFSSFEKHLRLFRQVFDKQQHAYAWLTGDTATADRAKVVERFQRDPGVQAFFMTVKAGGVGLNLTAADYVFLLDPWWNPAAEDQAIARAHRIGQDRPVTVLRFIARNTIEEKIRRLQEQKKQLGIDFFATGKETPALSREELEVLLS